MKGQQAPERWQHVWINSFRMSISGLQVSTVWKWDGNWGNERKKESEPVVCLGILKAEWGLCDCVQMWLSFCSNQHLASTERHEETKFGAGGGGGLFPLLSRMFQAVSRPCQKFLSPPCLSVFLSLICQCVEKLWENCIPVTPTTTKPHHPWRKIPTETDCISIKLCFLSTSEASRCIHTHKYTHTQSTVWTCKGSSCYTEDRVGVLKATEGGDLRLLPSPLAMSSIWAGEIWPHWHTGRIGTLLCNLWKRVHSIC